MIIARIFLKSAMKRTSSKGISDEHERTQDREGFQRTRADIQVQAHGQGNHVQGPGPGTLLPEGRTSQGTERQALQGHRHDPLHLEGRGGTGNLSESRQSSCRIAHPSFPERAGHSLLGNSASRFFLCGAPWIHLPGILQHAGKQVGNLAGNDHSRCSQGSESSVILNCNNPIGISDMISFNIKRKTHMKKIKNAGFTLSELLFVLGFFSVVGLVGYVAVHFISKIW